MKTTVLALLAAAGVATAQIATTTAYTGNTICAQDILDTCLSQQSAGVDACAPTDYSCQCNAYNIILTCYNNCPSDPRRYSAQQQVVAFCNAASQYPSTTIAPVTSGAAVPAASSPAVTPSPGAGKGTGGVAGTTAGSASAAAPTSTGAAAGLAIPAGGLALGLVGLFL